MRYTVLFLAALSGVLAQVSTDNACGIVPLEDLARTSFAALPDPFMSVVSGNRIAKKADWACRRAELSTLIQQDELGPIPGPPDSFGATLVGNQLLIDVVVGDKSTLMNISVAYPTDGSTGPFPAFIGMGGISIPRPAGAAAIIFPNSAFAQQSNQSSRGVGQFYDLFGKDHPAGAMAAWAWGVSRIIDALEIMPEANINTARIGVTGCSRNGKGALVAGAFEERIALTIPQESGSGGSACWRLSNAQIARGETVQGSSEIVQENVWLSSNFDQFANDIDLLPFDHHSLAGLVAPRGMLVIENTGFEWLGPMSSFGCMTAANMVYQGLGVPDQMGFSQVGNHSHCAFPAAQQPDLDAFINKFLFGQNTDTSIMKSDGVDLGFDQPTWIPWTVPQLV